MAIVSIFLAKLEKNARSRGVNDEGLILTDKLSKHYGKRNGFSFRRMLPNLEASPFVGLLCDHLLQTVIISLMGIVLLYLGKRKLSRIE